MEGPHADSLLTLFQLSDCYRGVVFDSLDTLFARNTPSALLSLLKAIGNREHIYLLNMAQDYTAMKAQEKAKKEQEGETPLPGIFRAFFQGEERKGDTGKGSGEAGDQINAPTWRTGAPVLPAVSSILELSSQLSFQ